MNERNALQITDVTVRRGENHLVEDVSLTIPAGSHWAVLGPNGAGKSTILKLAGGRLYPTTGSVQILGEQIGRTDVRELQKRIGYVDPKQRLDDISAYEAVLSGVSASNGYIQRFAYAPHRSRATEMLELVGMDDKSDRLWSQMSQGEKARTLIARALVTDPQMLLLDEPSTGLDLPGRETLLRVVDDLRASHPQLTTVLITHHVEEVAASTTDVLMVRDGGIQASGPVDEVMTAANLGVLYDMDVQLQRVEGRWFAFSG
ncbi:ATP-binding cassette domain-containing protein [Corynebacterium sp.]|uniref:ABC transporter ATP-binding protein n=1 Tax=Corynebacterium sp. TaxID=1720 RepID=UPI0028ACD203|nr:ATP-binding cassette domain-containing protein [Corynebacterium sp.]